MKHILKELLILFTCCLFFFSCDSFLTTPPLDQIGEEQWWSDKAQVRMMVNNAYTHLPNHEEIVLSDCMTDNATHRDAARKDIGNGSYTSQNSIIRGQWKYTSIAHLNYIIEGIEKAKKNLTDSEYNQFNAEVRFIRAFIYYNMLFYYGDVPLITKTLTVSESRQTSRQPRSEVLSFVLSELEDYVLANIDAIETNETGRVNKHVVNAFLSRIHLYEKNYNKVITYADAVINSNIYALHTSYDELFRPQSDVKNKEVIFERQYSSPLYVHSLNRDLSPASSIYGGWSHVLPLQELVSEYECINGHGIDVCDNQNCPYANIRKEHEFDNDRGEYMFRDPRLNATIMYPFYKWMVNGKVLSTFGVDDPNSKDYVKKETHMTGYLVTKWVDLQGEFADRTRSSKNMTIIRYADILLMKAEALIEKNENLQEALSLINQVRVRVGMPEISSAGQVELRAKLRHERRVETAFEGLRYFDIIRWKIGSDVKDGKVYGARMKAVSDNMDNKFIEERFWDEKMNLYPVPQAALDNNSNLTQNQGW